MVWQTPFKALDESYAQITNFFLDGFCPAIGVPDIWPVRELRIIPVGRKSLPILSLKVYGGLPPEGLTDLGNTPQSFPTATLGTQKE